jgi:hypothetical protein
MVGLNCRRHVSNETERCRAIDETTHALENTGPVKRLRFDIVYSMLMKEALINANRFQRFDPATL